MAAGRPGTGRGPDTTHPGIRLAVTIAGQPVIEGDSDWLHYQAVFGGHALGEWHTLLWQDGGVCVLIQPLELADPPDVPDDLAGLG